jgi:hypothetical protein
LGDSVLMTDRWPYGFVITDVRASLKTPTVGTSNDVVLDVLVNGSSVLDSNQLVIPGELKTSVQSGLPVIESAVISDDDEITIVSVSPGTGNVAAGLKVRLIGYAVDAA